MKHPQRGFAFIGWHRYPIILRRRNDTSISRPAKFIGNTAFEMKTATRHRAGVMRYQPDLSSSPPKISYFIVIIVIDMNSDRARWRAISIDHAFVPLLLHDYSFLLYQVRK